MSTQINESDIYSIVKGMTDEQLLTWTLHDDVEVEDILIVIARTLITMNNVLRDLGER